MPKKAESKVSEKSTKQELWSAYNEVVARVSGEVSEAIADKTVNVAMKNLSEAKLRINTELDELLRKLLTDFNDLENVQEQIAKSKKALLENFDRQKTEISAEIDRAKMQWTEEEARLIEEMKSRVLEEDKKRARETEEFNYNLAQSRKKEQDQFEIRKIEREKILSEKENRIAAREDEIKEMEKQIKEFSAKLEAEVKSAKEILQKDLTARYESELKEIKMQKEHEAKYAEIKLSNLENMTKSQAEEIDNLKKQLYSNNLILKDMAVTAIEAKGGKFKSASLSENS